MSSSVERNLLDPRWGARTWQLEDPGPLSPLLAPGADLCAFLDPYLGMVSSGIAAVHDAASLREAGAWWARVVDALEQESDLVGHLHTGPIAFVVMAQDGSDGCRVVVPANLVARELTPDGTRLAWRTWTSDAPPPPGQPVREDPPRRPQGVRITDDGVAEFRDRVAAARDALADQPGAKLVVGRTVRVTADAPMDRRWLIRTLERTCPGSTVFCIDGLVGASPQVLLRRTRGLVRTEVLSGALLSSTPEHEARLAAMQASSSPVFQRHRAAVNSTVAAVATHALARPHASGPLLRRLPGVTHLLTDITTLIADETDTLELLSRLHPAVDLVGLPREDACQWLDAHENLERGRFGAPVGWIDGDGSCDFAVALRCGQLSADATSIELFAEAAVIDQMSIDDAVALSEVKLAPMYGAVGLAES